MISLSALCFVLVLSYTSASTDSKAEVDNLMEQISSEATNEMATVAKAVRQDPKVSALDLHSMLLKTLRNGLQKMGSKIKELAALTHDSIEKISKSLSTKINENEKLKEAMVAKGKQSPRVIGAFIIGVTQIVTDVVNVALRRY